MIARRVVASIILVVGVLAWSAPAQSQDDSRYAALDQPGPALEAPAADLDAAFDCPDDIATARHDPVLMVPGTTLSTERNYGWNWIPALSAEGIPVCTVELHERGMADLQRSVENVVHAVLRIHEMSGRPVRMIGYSQGGLQVRFALRFWPEVRAAVSEVVQLAAVNRGSQAATTMCVAGCAVAVLQMKLDSDLVQAINSRAETSDGIDYTSIYSRYDELATPAYNGYTSSIDGAANIALQDVCPTNVAEHLVIGTIDPVAYALGLDALTHPGPADPSRIPAWTCSQVTLPGVDPVQGPIGAAQFAVEVVEAVVTAPPVTEAPPLRCYITASCAESEAAPEGPGGSTLGTRSDASTNSRSVMSRAEAVGSLANSGGSALSGLAVLAAGLGLSIRHRQARRPRVPPYTMRESRSPQ